MVRALLPVSLAALAAFLPAPAPAQYLPVRNDPLVRMPGTQPGDGVTLDPARNCQTCHFNYDSTAEPGFAWRGSMMSQAARDPLFWSCLAVAGQDSLWAIGRPNATDLCLRCHLPRGWLAGRSEPPNGASMTGSDFDGVQCDFCHRMYDPFHQDTFSGRREGNDWDEALGLYNSRVAAFRTLDADQTQARTVRNYSGLPFFRYDRPFSHKWDENGSGQYFVSKKVEKRASFADAQPLHDFQYSRYHKSRYFCGTCHDVSNPVLANLRAEGTPPGDRRTILTSEEDPAHSYAPVERTFSEFLLSDYGQPGGAPGIGPYSPAVFNTSRVGNFIGSCQDCHMPDVVGRGCFLGIAPLRPSGSAEHPRSGQPFHDLTGGNAWVPWLLASTVTSSPNYDARNRQLLDQPALLTMELNTGVALDPQALLAGVARVQETLRRAASLEGLTYAPATGEVRFRIQNQTGHKLITGFPEGRRMFVQVKVLSGTQLIHEVNPYDAAAGTLKGLDPHHAPGSPPLGPLESHRDALVYEAHRSSVLTGEARTFHFVLSTGVVKDNRIPPRGFRIAQARARGCEPVVGGDPMPTLFTAAEYAGGWDDVRLFVPPGGDRVVVSLWYQTTSREYVEFLRDEIRGTGRRTLPAWAYVAQTNPWFTRLRAWGDVLWELWDRNKHVPGAAPILMAQAFWP
jgi:hypothetical protein